VTQWTWKVKTGYVLAVAHTKTPKPDKC